MGIEGPIWLARRDNVALRRGMLGGALRVLASRWLPTPAQRDEHREENELQIEEETLLPDVQEIVAELRADVPRRLPVDLSDAREAWAHV